MTFLIRHPHLHLGVQGYVHAPEPPPPAPLADYEDAALDLAGAAFIRRHVLSDAVLSEHILYAHATRPTLLVQTLALANLGDLAVTVRRWRACVLSQFSHRSLALSPWTEQVFSRVCWISLVSRELPWRARADQCTMRPAFWCLGDSLGRVIDGVTVVHPSCNLYT